MQTLGGGGHSKRTLLLNTHSNTPRPLSHQPQTKTASLPYAERLAGQDLFSYDEDLIKMRDKSQRCSDRSRPTAVPHVGRALILGDSFSPIVQLCAKRPWRCSQQAALYAQHWFHG